MQTLDDGPITSPMMAVAVDTLLDLVQPKNLSSPLSLSVLARSDFLIQLARTLQVMVLSLGQESSTSSRPPSPSSCSFSRKSISISRTTEDPHILTLTAKLAHVCCVLASGDSLTKVQLLRPPVLNPLLAAIQQLHEWRCQDADPGFDYCRMAIVLLLKTLSQLLTFYDQNTAATGPRARQSSASASSIYGESPTPDDESRISSDMDLTGVSREGAIILCLASLSCSRLPELEELALSILHKFCCLNNSQNHQRHEKAALTPGLLPHLQSLIQGTHGPHTNLSLLRQFAIDILLLFPRASARVRTELKKYGGVQFYLDAMDEKVGPAVMEVLCDW